jgi:hypothetical protein
MFDGVQMVCIDSEDSVERQWSVRMSKGGRVVVVDDESTSRLTEKREEMVVRARACHVKRAEWRRGASSLLSCQTSTAIFSD